MHPQSPSPHLLLQEVGGLPSGLSKMPLRRSKGPFLPLCRSSSSSQGCFVTPVEAEHWCLLLVQGCRAGSAHVPAHRCPRWGDRAGRGPQAGKSLLCPWGDALSSSGRFVWEEQVWRRAGCVRRVSPCAEVTWRCSLVLEGLCGFTSLLACPQLTRLLTALSKPTPVTTRCCSWSGSLH